MPKVYAKGNVKSNKAKPRTQGVRGFYKNFESYGVVVVETVVTVVVWEVEPVLDELEYHQTPSTTKTITITQTTTVFVDPLFTDM